MQRRRIGSSELEVSVVGLGGNNFGGRIDREATRRVVLEAIDRGITLIDTADAYNAGASEECLGEILGARRNDVVLEHKWRCRAAIVTLKSGWIIFVENEQREKAGVCRRPAASEKVLRAAARRRRAQDRINRLRAAAHLLPQPAPIERSRAAVTSQHVLQTHYPLVRVRCLAAGSRHG